LKENTKNMFPLDLPLDYHNNMKKQLIIIAPAPEEDKYSHRLSALASFNFNLVEAMRKADGELKIKVIADNNNANINAEKVWEKDNLRNYSNIIKEVKKNKGSEQILIHFEWTVFGKSLFFLVFFPLFLLWLKIIGKKITVVFHGVSFDFAPILGSGLINKLFNIFSYLFYGLSSLFIDKIIVTEEALKNRLTRIPFARHKVFFVAHGVDGSFMNIKTAYPEKTIRLGYFGFINPYKGPALLLELFAKMKLNYFLNFYGGKSPSLVQKKDYQNYIQSFYRKAKENNVKITGFLNEKKLIDAFGQTDIAVFPYPSFLSSSGMLALCFSLKKPFIMSRSLEEYFQSEDFRCALSETGLKKEDFIFDFNRKSLEDRIDFVKKNYDKFVSFCAKMAKKRAWSKIGKQYLSLIYN